MNLKFIDNFYHTILNYTKKHEFRENNLYKSGAMVFYIDIFL